MAAPAAHAVAGFRGDAGERRRCRVFDPSERAGDRLDYRRTKILERRSKRTTVGGEIVLRVLERLLRVLQPVLGLRRPVGHGGQLQPGLFESDGRGLGLRAALAVLGDGIGDAFLGGTHLIRRGLLLEHGLTVCGRGLRHVTLIGFQHIRAETVRRLLEAVFECASEQPTALGAVEATVEGLRRGLAAHADLLVDHAAETLH